MTELSNLDKENKNFEERHELLFSKICYTLKSTVVAFEISYKLNPQDQQKNDSNYFLLLNLVNDGIELFYIPNKNKSINLDNIHLCQSLLFRYFYKNVSSLCFSENKTEAFDKIKSLINWHFNVNKNDKSVTLEEFNQKLEDKLAFTDENIYEQVQRLYSLNEKMKIGINSKLNNDLILYSEILYKYVKNLKSDSDEIMNEDYLIEKGVTNLKSEYNQFFISNRIIFMNDIVEEYNNLFEESRFSNQFVNIITLPSIQEKLKSFYNFEYKNEKEHNFNVESINTNINKDFINFKSSFNETNEDQLKRIKFAESMISISKNYNPQLIESYMLMKSKASDGCDVWCKQDIFIIYRVMISVKFNHEKINFMKIFDNLFAFMCQYSTQNIIWNEKQRKLIKIMKEIYQIENTEFVEEMWNKYLMHLIDIVKNEQTPNSKSFDYDNFKIELEELFELYRNVKVNIEKINYVLKYLSDLLVKWDCAKFIIENIYSNILQRDNELSVNQIIALSSSYHNFMNLKNNSLNFYDHDLLDMYNTQKNKISDRNKLDFLCIIIDKNLVDDTFIEEEINLYFNRKPNITIEQKLNNYLNILRSLNNLKIRKTNFAKMLIEEKLFEDMYNIILEMEEKENLEPVQINNLLYLIRKNMMFYLYRQDNFSFYILSFQTLNLLKNNKFICNNYETFENYYFIFYQFIKRSYSLDGNRGDEGNQLKIIMSSLIETEDNINIEYIINYLNFEDNLKSMFQKKDIQQWEANKIFNTFTNNFNHRFIDYTPVIDFFNHQTLNIYKQNGYKGFHFQQLRNYGKDLFRFIVFNLEKDVNLNENQMKLLEYIVSKLIEHLKNSYYYHNDKMLMRLKEESKIQINYIIAILRYLSTIEEINDKFPEMEEVCDHLNIKKVCYSSNTINYLNENPSYKFYRNLLQFVKTNYGLISIFPNVCGFNFQFLTDDNLIINGSTLNKSWKKETEPVYDLKKRIMESNGYSIFDVNLNEAKNSEDKLM